MTPTQLPDESPRAFAAFKLYVEMGDKRSIRRLCQKHGKDRATCERWSKKYHWQKRLRELALQDCQRAISASEQAMVHVAKELERERARFRQRAITASRKATERAMQILKQPLGRSKPSDAARLLVAGDAIGRAALELSPTGAPGAVGLNPITPPIIHVTFHRDALSDYVKELQDRFFAAHPELKRPKNGLLLESNGTT